MNAAQLSMNIPQLSELIAWMLAAFVFAAFIGGFVWSGFMELSKWINSRPSPAPSAKALRYMAKLMRLRAANLEIQAEKLDAAGVVAPPRVGWLSKVGKR